MNRDRTKSVHQQNGTPCPACWMDGNQFSEERGFLKTPLFLRIRLGPPDLKSN